MASNPVFDRIEKDAQGYAGFERQSSPGGYGPQAGAPAAWGPAQEQMSAAHLEEMYGRPAADPRSAGRMTLDDVMMKSLGLFAVLLVCAAGAWYATATTPGLGMGLWGVGMIGTLVLGLVIAFKKTISVPLIVLYAALEGLFVGAISRSFAGAYEGIVGQAVLATLCVFAAMFLGWKAGFVKVTARSRRIFGLALLGYMLFALVNLVYALVTDTPFGFGGSGPLGIAISVLAVGLASYSLAIDFDSIDQGVRSGLPEKYSWLMAHGLIVTVVWLYLEILRLLARLQSND